MKKLGFEFFRGKTREIFERIFQEIFQEIFEENFEENFEEIFQEKIEENFEEKSKPIKTPIKKQPNPSKKEKKYVNIKKTFFYTHTPSYIYISTFNIFIPHVPNKKSSKKELWGTFFSIKSMFKGTHTLRHKRKKNPPKKANNL